MTDLVTMEQWKRELSEIARTEVKAALGESGEGPMPPGIAKRLVLAQGFVHAVEKDSEVRPREGERGPRYKYAGTDDVVAEARAALQKAGLSLLRVGWHVENGRTYDVVDENGQTRPWRDADEIVPLFMLVSADGETWRIPRSSMPIMVGKGRPEDKARAGALTYCLGYVLLGLLQIPRVDEGTEVDQRDDHERGPARPAHAQPRHEQQRAEAPQNGNKNGGGAKTLEQCINADELLAACARGRSNASKYVGPAREKAIAVVRQHAERLKVPVERALDAAGLLWEPGASADG